MPRDWLALPAERPLNGDWLDPTPWRLPDTPGRHAVLAAEPAAHAPPVLHRSAGTVELTASNNITGVLVPFNAWTEIRSRAEGHFLERFAPGSLRRSIAERLSKVRGLFDHGLDVRYGRQVVFAVQEVWEDPDAARFSGRLFDSAPELLKEGLRHGAYGVSVGFRAVEVDTRHFPRRSDYNPKGLAENTVTEAELREISITAFPSYGGTTVELRHDRKKRHR